MYYDNIVALDVEIDRHSSICLVEINVGIFNAYAFQFIRETILGKYTDDIFDIKKGIICP